MELLIFLAFTPFMLPSFWDDGKKFIDVDRDAELCCAIRNDDIPTILRYIHS